MDLPTDRAVLIEDASPQVLAMSIDPLPEHGPAVLTYLYQSADASEALASASRLPAKIVDEMLFGLEYAAIELYPAWLPQAAEIRSPAGAGTAAVRALALRLGAQSSNFGPFVADLAVRALHHEVPKTSAHAAAFAAEVRAAGLIRVVAASFGREQVGILVMVPDGLAAAEQRALATACDWLADHGRVGVWLAGARLSAVDWLARVSLDLPGGGPDQPAANPRGGRDLSGGTGPVRPVVSYPPVTGRPHPASRAERALEAALAPRAWAAGRCWNRRMSLNSLINPVQPDLVWDDARCVVEIDGDDHLDRQKYARDRARDVDLQLAGYAVLRFTNDQVLTDTEAVVAKLGRFLAGRRLRSAEGSSNGN